MRLNSSIVQEQKGNQRSHNLHVLGLVSLAILPLVTVYASPPGSGPYSVLVLFPDCLHTIHTLNGGDWPGNKTNSTLVVWLRAILAEYSNG